MFEVLTDKLNAAFNRLTSRGRLAEKDVDEALRQIRLALLEADVNFKVARDFVAKVRERAVGQDVLESLSPGQTSLLIAADLRRPAAIEQLVALGKQMDVPVYSEDTSSTTVKVARAGIDRARELGLSWAIIDTGGRLHIDKEMMRELVEVHDRVSPHEVILVLDAMTGQDAVQAAEEFHRQVPLTGLIMTKLDGDARGGAALSVTRVTGIPIKFLGMGERTDALEPFHPDRLASRILGMGDVLTLVEKAQEVVDEKRAKELEKKLRKASFDLEDFLEQLQNLKRMGSIGQFMEMIPGFSQMSKRLPKGAFDEGELTKVEAIIHSMTPQERRNPDMINGSRRRRIALGSGTKPQDINQLINQFGQAQKMMRQMTQGRGPKNLANIFK